MHFDNKQLEEAKSKLYGQDQFESLESNLRIFSMILSIELHRGILNISVNTVDNKYSNLELENPDNRLETSIT